MENPAPTTHVVAPGSFDAPVILWDTIQAMGVTGPLAHMTLALELWVPDGKGGALQRTAVVAHLRMNFNALAQLKESIAAIELLARPAEGGKKN